MKRRKDKRPLSCQWRLHDWRDGEFRAGGIGGFLERRCAKCGEVSHVSLF